MPTDRINNGVLDLDRGNAGYGTGGVRSSLDQGRGDIIAVPRRALAAMTRAHAVAAVVEDATDQQSAGICPSCIAIALLSKLLLDSIKQVLIEDRRVSCGAD